jgi:hypothetical protein
MNKKSLTEIVTDYVRQIRGSKENERRKINKERNSRKQRKLRQ